LASTRYRVVCVKRKKIRRSADLFALIWKKKIARLDVWLRAFHPLMREYEHGNHATVILYTQPIAEFL
jgi:hypothetical protein